MPEGPRRRLATALGVVAMLSFVQGQGSRHEYAGSSEMRSNPERGFRHELHGACTGEGRTANGTKARGLDLAAMQEMAQYNLTIAQVYCYLPTTPTLDNATLESITTAMQVLRAHRVKALWRFAYDRLAPGEQNYTADLIISHIDQLVPVFNQGMDVVYALQAGFIGSWGEWHSSKNRLEFNKTATQMVVAKALFSLLPSDKKVTIRTWNAKVRIPLVPRTACTRAHHATVQQLISLLLTRHLRGSFNSQSHSVH